MFTVAEGTDAPYELGKIVVELRPDKAPKTVENFLSLVENGFYKGLIFHRVIKGFMIQGGGMTTDFDQKPCKSIRGEFIANGYMGNDLKHKRGTISMARTSDPDSASSQFFIMHEDAPHLDAQYAAFVQVVEGMEVVDKIAACKTGRYGFYSDVPRVCMVITDAAVVTE
jgi:peptidyl-prolyl cis-trans isomerase B (cyclophilin B)